MSSSRDPLELLNRPVGAFTDASVPAVRHRPRWLWLLLPGAAAVAFWVFSAQPQPVPLAAKREVGTPNSVETAPVPGAATQITAAGFIKADQLATVSAEVTGTLKKTYVQRGDRVKKGDAIAALDTASLSSQLKFAQVQLKVAQNNEQQARERLPLAEARFRRIELLKDEQVVPPQDYEDAKSEVTERRAEVQRYGLQAESAAIDIQGRQIDLERATIRAPFDGIIVSLDAAVGEVVSPVSAAGGFARTGIATLVDTRHFYAEVWVPEKSLGKLESRQRVSVKPDALPELAVGGSVAYISPLVDEQRAAVLVRIALEQAPQAYKHNMSVHVDFL